MKITYFEWVGTGLLFEWKIIIFEWIETLYFLTELEILQNISWETISKRDKSMIDKSAQISEKSKASLNSPCYRNYWKSRKNVENHDYIGYFFNK